MVGGLLPYLTIPEFVKSLAGPALEVTIDLSLDSWVTFVALFLLCQKQVSVAREPPIKFLCCV